MRARNIKPGFFKNEVLAELPPLARILFSGLWCLADRAGRLEDRPRRIKAEVLTYDRCDVDHLLQLLHDKGFICRYEVNGMHFIEVSNFTRHQSPHHREAESCLPAPPASSNSPRLSPALARLSPSDSLIPDSLIPDTLIPDSNANPVASGESVCAAENLLAQEDVFPAAIDTPPTAPTQPSLGLRNDMSLHVAECRPDCLNEDSLIADSRIEDSNANPVASGVSVPPPTPVGLDASITRDEVLPPAAHDSSLTAEPDLPRPHAQRLREALVLAQAGVKPAGVFREDSGCRIQDSRVWCVTRPGAIPAYSSMTALPVQLCCRGRPGGPTACGSGGRRNRCNVTLPTSLQPEIHSRARLS